MRTIHLTNSTIPISNAMVERDLEEYRNGARHLNTHYEASVHCNVLPFHIAPCVLYNYYFLLQRFTNVYSRAL